MNHQGTKTIETERLVLRPYRMGDAEAMYRNYCTDEDVTRYLTWYPHASIDETLELLKIWVPQYVENNTYNWAIEYGDEIIGGFGTADVNELRCSAEVGYCIGKGFWGQGIVAEAGRAVLDYMFNEVGFNRIMAVHDVLNPASGRVMQKMGMKREGCMRQLLPRKAGGYGDCDLYAIVKDDLGKH